MIIWKPNACMNFSITSAKRKPAVLSALLIASLLFFNAATHAAAVEPQTLLYQVQYQGQDAGQLEVIISREDSGYLITSISHLSLLAQMFLEATTVKSRFEKAGDSYRLVSGEEIATESGDVRRKFDVDYSRNQINFIKGEPLAFDPSVRMDADGFPLTLVMDKLDDLAGTQVLSVSPKRGRLYVHDKVREETITGPAGEFETRVLVIRRTDNAERTINYWLRKDNQIPVRIVTGKPGKETILNLLTSS